MKWQSAIFLLLTSALLMSTNLHSQEYRNLPPSPPQNLEARPGLDRVLLSWTPNTESDLQGYNIYLRNGKGSYTPYNKEIFQSKEPDNRSGSPRAIRPRFKIRYFIGNLSESPSYRLRITAVDRAGNESEPSDIQVTLMQHGYPTANTYWPLENGDTQNTRRVKYVSSQTGKLREVKRNVGKSILIGPTGKWFSNITREYNSDYIISENSDIVYYYLTGRRLKRGGIQMADSAGNIIWRNAGGNNFEATSRILITHDGQLVYSTPHGLVGLGYDGFSNWFFSYPAINEYGGREELYSVNIAIDDSNNIYVVSPTGKGHCYKLDSSGNLLWKMEGWFKTRIMAPNAGDKIGIIVLDDGSILLFNKSLVSISDSGLLQWERKLYQQFGNDQTSVCLLNNGNIFLAGETTYYVFSSETGEILYQRAAPTKTTSNHVLCGGDDTIYIVRDTDYVQALSADLKIDKWRYDEDKGSLSNPVIDSDGLLYVLQSYKPRRYASIEYNALVFQIGD